MCLFPLKKWTSSEVKVDFKESIANLFVNGLFKIKLHNHEMIHFSKGFCMFFSYKSQRGVEFSDGDDAFAPDIEVHGFIRAMDGILFQTKTH